VVCPLPGGLGRRRLRWWMRRYDRRVRHCVRRGGWSCLRRGGHTRIGVGVNECGVQPEPQVGKRCRGIGDARCGRHDLIDVPGECGDQQFRVLGSQSLSGVLRTAQALGLSWGKACGPKGLLPWLRHAGRPVAAGRRWRRAASRCASEGSGSGAAPSPARFAGDRGSSPGQAFVCFAAQARRAGEVDGVRGGRGRGARSGAGAFGSCAPARSRLVCGTAVQGGAGRRRVRARVMAVTMRLRTAPPSRRTRRAPTPGLGWEERPADWSATGIGHRIAGLSSFVKDYFLSDGSRTLPEGLGRACRDGLTGSGLLVARSRRRRTAPSASPSAALPADPPFAEPTTPPMPALARRSKPTGDPCRMAETTVELPYPSAPSRQYWDCWPLEAFAVQ